MKRITTGFVLVVVACLAAAFGAGFAIYLRPADASRNASGTYSIPNTFVSGTTISSSAMNSNFSDLSTELTDSLDRSGKGGMLAALRGVDGTVAAPAFSYTSETGSGEYRIGTNDLGWSVNGTKKLELTSSAFTVTPNLAVTGDVAVNTNKFTVTASSGNTAVAGTLTIGGGTAISKSLSGSSTVDVGTVSAASCTASQTITVTGTTAGAPCAVSPDAALTGASEWVWCYSTADTCNFRVCNLAAVGSATGSHTYTCRTFNN